MNKVGTEDWFNSDEKVNFYTGLPNSYVLMTVFEFVSSGVQHSSLSALTQFQVSNGRNTCFYEREKAA